MQNRIPNTTANSTIILASIQFYVQIYFWSMNRRIKEKMKVIENVKIDKSFLLNWVMKKYENM